MLLIVMKSSLFSSISLLLPIACNTPNELKVVKKAFEILVIIASEREIHYILRQN